MRAEEIELCRWALGRAISRYRWRGRWDEREFLEEIFTEIQRRQGRVRGRDQHQIAENAAIFCYSRRWYADCRKDGTVEQSIALSALWAHIYRSVFYKVRGNEEIAQEIAQQVLISVWKARDSVREPGVFIKFVLQAALRQIPKTVRVMSADEEELMDDFPDEQEDNDQVVEDELSELEALIRHCLPKKERQMVILEYFLSGRAIGDIAKIMGKKSGAISTLKTRSIDQLRNCPEMVQWKNARSSQAAQGTDNLSQSVAHLLAVVEGAASEMSCDECRSWLPVYVEAEVSGFDVGQQYPEVRRHLDLCAECEAEYVDLLDSTLDEMSADWSDIPVPPPDLSFLPPLSFQAYLRWLLEGVIGQLQPLRLPQLDRQMEPLLRQLAALGTRPVPAAAKVFGPDQSYERLNLATYDVARSLLQNAPTDIQSDPALLKEWVGREARRAADHQRLSGEEVDAFVTAVTELICHNPTLLRQMA